MDDTGNTSIEVTNTSSAINIPAGGFRIFGNNPSTLSVNGFENNLNIQVYPNPASTFFQVNTSLEKVSIYDITGKLVNSYKGNFKKGHAFNISNLPKAVYIVKAENDKKEKHTIKLVKL